MSRRPPVTFARTRTTTDNQSFLDVRNTRLLPRHWGWWLALALAALSSVAVVALYLRAGYVAGTLEEHPVYVGSLKRANDHPDARAELGSPIVGSRVQRVEESWLSGETHLQFDVEGPRGAGRIDVVAQGNEPDSLLILRMKLTVSGPSRRVIALDGPIKR